MFETILFCTILMFVISSAFQFTTAIGSVGAEKQNFRRYSHLGRILALKTINKILIADKVDYLKERNFIDMCRGYVRCETLAMPDVHYFYCSDRGIEQAKAKSFLNYLTYGIKRFVSFGL